MPHLQHVPLSALRIDDGPDFGSVPLYAPLLQVLLDDQAVYRVPRAGSALSRWDQVLLLNLAFWTPGEPDDVLEQRAITADVVMHRAWHHLAHRALGTAATSVEGLMLGESIASAFDAYLVGVLLARCPGAEMLETQVPAMTAVLEEAGVSPQGIEALFTEFSSDPAGSFAALRELLFEVGVGLARAEGAEGAAEVLDAVSSHRLAPLLSHFELATWSLFARAHAEGPAAPALALDATLRQTPEPLAWLADHWLGLKDAL